MGSYLLYALVCGLAGAIPYLDLNYGAKSFGRAAIIGILNFAVGFFSAWLLTPFMYGPFAGFTSTVILFGVVNSAISGLMLDRFSTGSWLLVAFVSIALFRGCASMGMWQANDYQKLIGEVETAEWNENMQPIDPTHIRTVSKPQAEWHGNKVIGQAEGSLGSRYRVGEYSIQKVNNELYWVAPLEFRGIWKWNRYGHTTGFVMVSAEDRNRDPELVTGHELNYMPSAFFGGDLERHIYSSGYANRALTEYSFELDDNMKPWWVISVYELTIQYGGPKVKGVLLVDPNSGDIIFKEVGSIPDWIDRVYPQSFTEDYVRWYGEYIQGWWNTVLGEENIQVPTNSGLDDSAVTMIYGEDKSPRWFTGVTSSSSSDQSLTGFFLVDSRTGKAKKYQISGPNEKGVLEATNSSVANFEGYRGTQPIPYNLYGNFTWAVPVISQDNILQKIALVDGSNATVNLGDNVSNAVREYRSSLSSEGFSEAFTENANVESLRIEVDRVRVVPSGGQANYYLWTRDIPDKIFMASGNLTDELRITEPGDSLAISFLETTEGVVSLNSLDNRSFDIQTSNEQARLEKRRKEVEKMIQGREDKRQLRQQLDTLSAEELRKVREMLEQEGDGG